MTELLTACSATLATLGPSELNLHEFTRALDGEGWFGRTLTDPLVWGLSAAAIGSIVLAAIFVLRQHRDRIQHGPAWRHLAGALQLTAAQRRTLTQLARCGGHINPAPLVISRGCFDRSVQRRPGRRHISEIDALRRQLFD